jgi:parvulin-like peptidyl-prolyl isomerase
MKKIAPVMMAGTALLFLCSFAGAQSAADRLTRMAEGQLLYIDDTVLTVGDFATYLRNSGISSGGTRQRALDTLRGGLETYIDQNCIILDLDSTAILADPQSSRRARWRQAQVAGPLVYEHLILPQVKVDEAEVERLYRDSIGTLFTEPESREVRHILIAPQWKEMDGKRVKTPAQTAAARATADSLLVAIRAGASFDSLAAAVSADSASRVKNGYLGWIFPGNTVHDFDTAAFSGQPGDILGPVKTIYGYHLIKIEAERPETITPLSDALADEIRRRLIFVKSEDLGKLWADSMLAATRWTYNDAVLENLKDVPDTTWLLLVNDRDTVRYGEWEGSWMMFQRQRDIEGPGTLEQKHESLRLVGFPFLYIQTAEDFDYADDPIIVGERRQHLRSEAIRLAHIRLRELQTVPQARLDSIAATTQAETIEKPLHIQMIRARDTATIWEAYRSLVAGNDIATVAGWYHDNPREVRQRTWDRGWLAQDELPAPLWGAAWILNVGGFTRPIEHDSRYYILRLEARRRAPAGQEEIQRQQEALRHQYRETGLDRWRDEIRSGHAIRLNQSYWRRVQQLWQR